MDLDSEKDLELEIELVQVYKNLELKAKLISLKPNVKCGLYVITLRMFSVFK